MSGQRHVFGPFNFDEARGALTRDGIAVPVGAKAAAVLTELLRAGNEVVPKETLVEAAWPGAAIEESNLSVQVASLRKLLGVQPDGTEWITTVSRVGYRFAGPLTTTHDGEALAGRAIVAVLPFADATGGTDGRALADGFAGDIVTALSRFRWFAVVGHDDPGARYRLQGSVRRSGPRLRIGVHLVDGATGAEIFAQNYEPQSADMLAAQDEIALRVAGAIESALLKTDGARAGGVAPLDLVRRGTGLFHKVTPTTHREARELFREAAKRAPDLSEAWTWLARVSAGIIAYGWSDDPAADGAEGIAAGLAGIRLDDASPYAHYGLAIVSLYAGAPDQAVGAAERAVELSDGFALGHLVLGLARLSNGEPARAIESLERGIGLSSGDPQGFAWLNFLALAQLFSGDADSAAKTAARLLKLRPDWRPGFETMAACQVAIGELADAHRTLARMAALPPTSGDALEPVFAGNPEGAARMAELLATAWTPVAP